VILSIGGNKLREAMKHPTNVLASSNTHGIMVFCRCFAEEPKMCEKTMITKPVAGCRGGWRSEMGTWVISSWNWLCNGFQTI